MGEMPPRRTLGSRRLRKSISGTELRIWVRLRGRKLDGWKFRRQHPIGPYYVDFYCPAARLVIEINGPNHDHEARWAYDLRRQSWLEAEGYRVLTIPVSAIDEGVHEVMDTIYFALLEQEELGLTRRRLRPAAPPARPLRLASPDTSP